MKVLKTLFLASIMMFAVAATPFAQTTDLPESPTISDPLRVYLGGGLFTGAEDEFLVSKPTVGVAAGLYWPSKVIPIPGFHAFTGVLYDVSEATRLSTFDVSTLELQFRFIYYTKFSTDKAGLFMLLGPEYKYIQNEDPLAFSGSIFQAASGIGVYVGIGSSKQTRLSLVVERDILGDLEHRDWKILTGLSRGFDPKII